MTAASLPTPRYGFSQIEVLLVMILSALLLSVAVKSSATIIAQTRVHSAAQVARGAFSAARDAAINAGVRTAVRIDTREARIIVHTGSDTTHRFPLGELHGISLEASRDSMAYSPIGLGWGASNLRLIVRRATAAETISVSRLGRVR